MSPMSCYEGGKLFTKLTPGMTPQQGLIIILAAIPAKRLSFRG